MRNVAGCVIAIALLLVLAGCAPIPTHNWPPQTQPGAPDLVSPVMVDEQPAAGMRVRVTPQEYEGTDVHHSLYLPTDWEPGRSYPVLVEYTGNYHPASGSTGEVGDANLGYGLSGGTGFIWVVMPYIAEDRTRNERTWWGDRQATIDYCLTNLPRICEQYGGDPDNLFICGFSRGAIACGYIGLANDEIAALWRGMITHDHFDGQRQWGYPEDDRHSALQRLERLDGRPVLVCGVGAQYLEQHLRLGQFTFLAVEVGEIYDIPEGRVIHPHTDLWLHRENAWRDIARRWLQMHAFVTDD